MRPFDGIVARVLECDVFIALWTGVVAGGEYPLEHIGGKTSIRFGDRRMGSSSPGASSYPSEPTIGRASAATLAARAAPGG